MARALGYDGMHEWSLRAIRAAALARKGDIKGKAEECSRILADQELRGKIASNGAVLPGRADLPRRSRARASPNEERYRASRAKRFPRRSEYFATELPKARFALAKALRVAGREPERARELAESARKDLSSAQGSESDVAEVDEWLGRGGR